MGGRGSGLCKPTISCKQVGGNNTKKNVDTTSASTLYCTVCPEASQGEVRLVAMGDTDCKWLTDIAVGVGCCQHENLERRAHKNESGLKLFCSERRVGDRATENVSI